MGKRNCKPPFSLTLDWESYFAAVYLQPHVYVDYVEDGEESGYFLYQTRDKIEERIAAWELVLSGLYDIPTEAEVTWWKHLETDGAVRKIISRVQNERKACVKRKAQSDAEFLCKHGALSSTILKERGLHNTPELLAGCGDGTPSAATLP